ncbi:MAG TPA: membrane protein insertase YidC [Methylomirabilota bacterium]
MSTEKRAILAAVLMAVVFIVGQYFMPPPETPAPQTPSPATPGAPTAPTAQSPEPAKAPPTPAPPPAPVRPQPAGPRPPQRVVTVETPLYRASISSEGGKLQAYTLKYRGEKPMVVVGDLGPGGLVVGPPERAEPVPMQIAGGDLQLGRDRPTGEMVLTGEVDGLRVRETLTFRADGYTIDTAIRIDNAGPAPRSVTVSLPWSTRQAWKETAEKFLGQHPTEIVWAKDGHVERLQALCELPDVATDGRWIATDSIFYLAAFIPQSGGFRLVARGEPKEVCDARGKDPVGRATMAVEATPTIAPNQAWEGRVVVYAGPKEYDRLRALGLDDTIDFGSFLIPQSWTGGRPLLPMAWLGVPILLLMNWIYQFVGNYGVAIIVVTVVSKVLFYPLTVKGMRSMKAMQALGPQINALRSKYKSDPQRLQRETMELYRANKVNPMGGCLPMLAQAPIFYALYLALSVSPELQNAPFICFGRLFNVDLWICDLAGPDPTYILPILMGITMFIQQKMTPTAGDPAQARMMLFMPVIFTLMFLVYPIASGLALYWAVSNVLQIGQQWLMDRSSRPAESSREARNGSRREAKNVSRT